MEINDIDHFIDESLVQNVELFESLKSDLICIICHGLLNDPVNCASCEVPFCSHCISNWKLNNDQCPLKCSQKLELKSISRLRNSLMDKVILKCNFCKVEMSLNSYPKHYISCLDKTRIVQCPLCSQSEISLHDLKTKQIDINLIPSLKNKYENEILELKNSFNRERTQMIDEFNKNKNELNLEILNLSNKLKALEYNSQLGYSNTNETLSFDNIQVNKITTNCKHYPNCNCVFIFSCCNKAYNCWECHNLNETHKHIVSKTGYCMNCGTKFTDNDGDRECSNCLTTLRFY